MPSFTDAGIVLAGFSFRPRLSITTSTVCPASFRTWTSEKSRLGNFALS